jgi:hypothetical protein
LLVSIKKCWRRKSNYLMVQSTFFAVETWVLTWLSQMFESCMQVFYVSINYLDWSSQDFRMPDQRLKFYKHVVVDTSNVAIKHLTCRSQAAPDITQADNMMNVSTTTVSCNTFNICSWPPACKDHTSQQASACCSHTKSINHTQQSTTQLCN